MTGSLGGRGLALAAAALVLVMAGLAAAAVLLRPTSTTSVGGMRVECIGVSDTSTCDSWANDVLADGPGIRVFNVDDLAVVRLVTPVLGLGDGCRADYVIERYPDETAATDEVPCPGD